METLDDALRTGQLGQVTGHSTGQAATTSTSGSTWSMRPWLVRADSGAYTSLSLAGLVRLGQSPSAFRSDAEALVTVDPDMVEAEDDPALDRTSRVRVCVPAGARIRVARRHRPVRSRHSRPARWGR